MPVIMLVVAIGLFGAARQMALGARLMASEGGETIAEVTGRERRRHTDTDGRVSYSHHLSYRFTTSAGQIWHDTHSVSRQLHDSVSTCSRIPVRYVPSRPELNRVEPERTGLVRLAMNLGSSLLFIGGVVLFWYLRRKRPLRRRPTGWGGRW
ncbi:MAG: DUF3592 domain-containing protein [Pararhodobacter sp.]|nr:DUF3592 domain-containing protein [Pararhodobacter sp.]